MKPYSLHSHVRPLTQLRFNKEGDLLFSSAKDSSAHVWRTKNGEKLGSFDSHNGSIWCIDVDSNTKNVATGGADGACMIWDAQTGKNVSTLICETAVRTCNFTKGGDILAVTTDAQMSLPGQIEYFDLRDNSGKPYQVVSGMDRYTKVTAAIFGIFDDTLVTAHANGEVSSWCQKTHEKKISFKHHESSINDLQRSIDGDFIITASKDCTSRLLDSRTLESLREYKTQQPVNSASISSIRDFVMLGGGQDHHEVTTTDSRQGKFVTRFYHKIYEAEIGRVKGHFAPVNTLAFHPDGKSFATGGEDGFIKYHYFDDSYYEFEFEY